MEEEPVPSLSAEEKATFRQKLAQVTHVKQIIEESIRHEGKIISYLKMACDEHPEFVEKFAKWLFTENSFMALREALVEREPDGVVGNFSNCLSRAKERFPEDDEIGVTIISFYLFQGIFKQYCPELWGAFIIAFPKSFPT